MRALDLIEKKRDGLELTAQEIRFVVDGCVSGSIPDYQITAWLMAAYLQGLTVAETVALTEALVESGNRLDLSDLGRVVDKHSTGGVGDKTTLVVAPLAASLGVPVAKLSGRALGHTGGTIDKLEAIPGIRTSLSVAQMKEQVRRIGIAVGAATEDLAAGDKKLYALRDATGTVASPGLIAASVMSKKIAGGAFALVLDVKVGSGAFLKKIDDARRLAKLMIEIGSSFGIATRAVLTSMDDVLGFAVGNSLEVAEAIDTLQGSGPPDLVEICELLAAEMVVAGGHKGRMSDALSEVRKSLSDCSALAAFERWVEAQGGDRRITGDRSLLPMAAHRALFLSPTSGIVAAVDAEKIGRAAGVLGAGRSAASQSIDPGAGIIVKVKLGDSVSKGEPLAELLSNDRQKLEMGLVVLEGAWTIGVAGASKTPLVLERIPKS